MAVILYRYAKSVGKDNGLTQDISGFADSNQVSNYAKDAVKWAIASGIITGYDQDHTIRPKGTATRAEAAAMIQRFIQNVLL